MRTGTACDGKIKKKKLKAGRSSFDQVTELNEVVSMDVSCDSWLRESKFLRRIKHNVRCRQRLRQVYKLTKPHSPVHPWSVRTRGCSSIFLLKRYALPFESIISLHQHELSVLSILRSFMDKFSTSSTHSDTL